LWFFVYDNFPYRLPVLAGRLSVLRFSWQYSRKSKNLYEEKEMRYLKVATMFFVAILFSISIGITPVGAQENKPAVPDVYRFDVAHTNIGFSVRHLGISMVTGRFKEFTGVINYDSSDVSHSSVEFTAKVASIDTGVQGRDDHLRSPDFFEVEKYPEMIFKSTRVESKGKTQFVVHGNLTLKGVTKEIAIPFELLGPIKDPRGSMRIGVEANLTLNRQDYGIMWSKTLDSGGLVVSNEVNIALRLEGVRQEAKPTAAK
jgi:polyisoprenoid-binding protein YceI